ncbi:sulfatase-like hydrolase/transferase [Candidatus Woesebacteria bacterium]|nr:sulfatase-like hydrolase/transferase [Candidatus Woesebacteria bacterium]MCB9802188.1 sulfatase-like hydrolase/transferase [Pseudomonadales bacterium]
MDSHPQYIFLFILDAVRKDHMSLYGYDRQTTSCIDKLSKNGTVYQRAISPSSYTFASVPSILGGKYPTEMTPFFDQNKKFTTKDFPNLDLLKERGYTTAFFTGNFVTSRSHTNLSDFFDHFWDELSQKETGRFNALYAPSSEILDAGAKYIEKNKQKKLFLCFHLMEAHGPYTKNKKSRFRDDKIFKKDTRKIDKIVNDAFTGIDDAVLQNFSVAPKYQIAFNEFGDDFEQDVNYYVAQYDQGIYEMDKQINIFVKNIINMGIAKRSKIAITSDHGELLGEDNIFFAHGIYCRPSLVHVPLMIISPDQTKSFNDKPFSLKNIIPTLLNEKHDDAEVMALHPKSMAVFNADECAHLHIGDYNHDSKINESLFLINQSPVEGALSNNFTSQLTTFKINNGVFREKTLSTTFGYNQILQKIHSINHALFREEKIKFSKMVDNYQKKISEQEAVIKTRNKELNNIYHSRFFILWQSMVKTLHIHKNISRKKVIELFKNKNTDEIKNLFVYKPPKI